MGKKHKEEKNSVCHSTKINMPSKKNEKKSVHKKLQQRMKDISEEPNHASVVAKPTFVSSPIQPKLKKKKKKKTKNTKKSGDLNVLPFGMNFDSVANVDSRDGNILADTKSFFKRGILIPEHCEIQSGKPGYIHEIISSEDGPAACVEELNMECNNVFIEPSLIEQISFTGHQLPKNKILLEMESPKEIFIRGKLNVQVLFGSIEILGWVLNDSTNNCATMYSPEGCSLLSLQPLQHCSNKRDKFAYKLSNLGLDSSLAQEIVDRLDGTKSLVIVDQAESTLVSYLGQHVPWISLYPQYQFNRKVTEIEKTLNCQIITNPGDAQCYTKSQEWDYLAETIAEEFQDKGLARVMVCGGKAVGKSTLLRFLVNRSIQQNGQVLFLDFDPGQPEFTIPGCVSVLRVNEPLLGPNYMHIRTPERSVYVGEVDLSKCPEQYIKSAQYIVDYCQSNPELSQMVWFINTMGYNMGLGVELTSSLIAMVQPTGVVQIDSVAMKRNFKDALIPENVLNKCDRWLPLPQHLDYSFMEIQSQAESGKDKSKIWGLQARITRSFLLLAYFHQVSESPSLSLTDSIPFRIPFSKLKLSILHEAVLPGAALSVMNAGLVALCVVGDDANFLEPSDATLPQVLVGPPMCPCLGYGIVRGVDVADRALFLVTPLSAAGLAAVNCLVMGTVALPTSVYFSAAAGLGQVPYVASGPGQPTSKLIVQRVNPTQGL